MIISFCLLLTGCGFHLRSKQEFPVALTSLYFSAKHPNSPLSVQLQHVFRSLHVQFVQHAQDARYSLLITRDHFDFTRPDIVDVSLPTSIKYLLISHVAIQDNIHKKIIASREFQLAQTQTLNQNQLYTSGANTFVHAQLSHEMSTLIYYWMISSNIKDVLSHASHPKTT